MAIPIATQADLQRAEEVIRRHLSPVPLIRSYALEQELGLSGDRRVWIKDYGWTPVGSFKVLGALNWMAAHEKEIGARPVTAHSSGNFAAGIAYAGMRYGKRVIIVMPDTAPRVKFHLTHSFGADIRTYDIATDHLTGERDELTEQITAQENAVQASPYDDLHVIAGNGVGGLEIAAELQRQDRALGLFLCPVSGGGLMAGHALALSHAFPQARIGGVEPAGAADFALSLEKGERTSIEHPQSICDGLLSYDVGEHNWPLLERHVHQAVSVADTDTCRAMHWLYSVHGLRTEPSGAIATAALLTGAVSADEPGDIVVVLSGRNADEDSFHAWLDQGAPPEE